jgi:hypothetical protein
MAAILFNRSFRYPMLTNDETMITVERRLSDEGSSDPESADTRFSSLKTIFHGKWWYRSR